ncbi:MAG: thiamine phosphate synthase [Chthonomonadales bacterium]
MRLRNPILMIVADPTSEAVRRAALAAEGGANAVQLRCPPEPTADQIAAFRLLKQICPTQTLLAINAHPSIIQELQPECVHLPEQGMGVAAVRALVAGRRILVGRSVHSVEKAKSAQDEGADYIVAGTIFASSSHPEIAPAGLNFLGRVCRAVRIPVIAIGGITPQNAPACIGVGAAGVAVRSGVLYARDPCGAARGYRTVLDGGPND